MSEPKKTLADAMKNAAANALISDEDIDGLLRLPSPAKLYPVHPAQQARNAELEALRPLRENFADEEDYLEARSGFNHRILPLLRPLPFVETKLADPSEGN